MSKNICRAPYCFVAYTTQEENYLNDFLGIQPAGKDIDTYLSTRTQAQLDSWLEYWQNIWGNICNRVDLAMKTANFYGLYTHGGGGMESGYYIHRDKCEYTTNGDKIEYASKSKCEKALKKMQEEERSVCREKLIDYANKFWILPVPDEPWISDFNNENFDCCGYLAELKVQNKIDASLADFNDAWDSFESSVKHNDWTGVRNFLFGNPDMKLIAGTVPIGPAGFASFAGLSGRALTIGKFIMRNWKTILGVATAAYGVSFGSEWFAKEGLIEQVSMPLSDQMRQYRYKADPATLKLIENYYAKYGTNIQQAKKMVYAWGWLWPFTWGNWKSAITSYENDYKERGVEIQKWETATQKPVISEKVKTYVRDVHDGDTIYVSPHGKNADTGESVEMPISSDKVHTSVRLAGINAPELSPKGEIVCTGIDLFSVDKNFADESRQNLVPLNDQEVTLLIDPNDNIDAYGRVIAVVMLGGKDINLDQLQKGLACYYAVGTNKYVDADKYQNACILAHESKVGMWSTAETETEKAKDVKVSFTSSPSPARIWIDGRDTTHNTPSNETKMKDVKDWFAVGHHEIEMIKSKYSGKVQVDFFEGDNGIIHIDLEEEVTPKTTPAEEKPAEKPAEQPAEKPAEIPTYPKPTAEVDPTLIPTNMTFAQSSILTDYLEKVWNYTAGTRVMSEAQRKGLHDNMNLYTQEQKDVLNLFLTDIDFYEWGKAQLSKKEFQYLCDKWHITDKWTGAV